MALPYRTTGSLRPAFAPARLVGLAVKHPSTFTLIARCPTVLRVPLCSSVTLWEETAPVKLPTRHLSLIHISEPTRLLSISYAVFCLKKKKKKKKKKKPDSETTNSKPTQHTP
eukprot:TRINITY_DN4508_c0_g1_i13.p1 TRINITY_DN4508_c0_g1~~TRINITY_DN4508_c0_g1_i13.p1  ORF type:complete len:113 (-),score=28.86 TRINITY_DN4508_c0_g1_i13:70-408(-)